LTDEPRSGTSRRLADDRVEEVVHRPLSKKPKTATHWSSREMPAETGLSSNSVLPIWRAFDLQPGRVESFKLSSDPLFIEKTRDVVGLYTSPPENAIVLCVDEKSHVQVLDRTQPVFPLRLGVPERQTHDYHRHGVTSLFAALNIASGKSSHRATAGTVIKNSYGSYARLIPRFQPSSTFIWCSTTTQLINSPTVQRLFLRHPLKSAFHADERKLAQSG